ncbi:MAG: hypothetical protein ACD_54C01119G0001 [uncultured bacterium]|nr:MAG: hypothetical protein ACD_54C01119G0001 [uncultured bacterium]
MAEMAMDHSGQNARRMRSAQSPASVIRSGVSIRFNALMGGPWSIPSCLDYSHGGIVSRARISS